MYTHLKSQLIESIKSLYIWIRTDTRNSSLEIGRGTKLNVGCETRGSVKLGNFCAIGRHVIFQGRNHIYTKPSSNVWFYKAKLGSELGYDERDIRVGHDVWIGNRVTILPGVVIGHGAIIGAGAVVTSDVEPFEIVGGTPAEHLKWRFPVHVREQLLEIEWWHWDEDKLERNQEFFAQNLSQLDPEVDLTERVV